MPRVAVALPVATAMRTGRTERPCCLGPTADHVPAVAYQCYPVKHWTLDTALTLPMTHRARQTGSSTHGATVPLVVPLGVPTHADPLSMDHMLTDH